MPVAGVESIAAPDRMVALVRGAFPRRRLAAADPLARHPPPAHFFGPRGILEIQDHRDASDVSFDMRRDVGVAAVEGEPMHAAVGLKKSDLFGFFPVGNIVNFESRRLLLFAAISFQVHQHDIAAYPHLVRMHALRDFNLSDNLRMLWIFDIEDRRPMRRVHVADERVAVLDYDLPATRHIRASDLSYVFADTKLWRIAVLLAHEFFSRSN